MPRSITKPRRKQFRYLHLDTLWRDYIYDYGSYSKESFLDRLRLLTTQPEKVDEQVRFCSSCSVPHRLDDMLIVGNPRRRERNLERVCGPCARYYRHCSDCNELVRYLFSPADAVDICDTCRADRYTYCGTCDAWYSDEHRCTYGCDCESPALRFCIPNDGMEPLANDTRVKVTLPAGEISDEGIYAIAVYLRRQARYYEQHGSAMVGLSHSLAELGNKWQAKQGNYTKRLSSFAYKTLNLKIEPGILSQVGTIAREHSTAVDFQIEITRDLNQHPSKYAHAESCWWQSYYESRCAFKSTGGFGIRTFDEYDHCSGRAWVMPMRRDDTYKNLRLTPTFETMTPDAYVVFNGYEKLSGYTPARILSHMAGMTYRKVEFSCSPIYVNGESGYIVATEEIADPFTDGELCVSTVNHSRLYETERKLANV